MPLKLSFQPNKRTVTIESGGNAEFVELYRAIRDWEASERGIIHPAILEGSGNIELADGTRTPRVMVFIGGWRLSATREVSITGGFVTARDAERNATHPVVKDSRSLVHLLAAETSSEAAFTPSEAQVRDALFRAARFREDWVVDPATRQIHRKGDATDTEHSVLGLYWFCKEEWLRDENLMGYAFPVSGDNRVPGPRVVRRFELADTWSIPNADLRCLVEGPLLWKGSEIVGEGRPPAGHPATSSVSLADRVTIGVITALPKEWAAVECHFDRPEDYKGPRTSTRYKIGVLPALCGGEHVVALVQSGMGNNAAAARAGLLFNDFQYMKHVVMIGIAGAVPYPSKPSDHVRLGDVVVSDRSGVIQYDMGKKTADGWIPRHQAVPPSAELLAAVRNLQGRELKTPIDWAKLLTRTAALPDSVRPNDQDDKLLATPPPRRWWDFLCGTKPDRYLEHPADPDRRSGEPRVFVGPIGAANTLQKDAVERDQLRDTFSIKAIEMEGAGIADAAYAFSTGYLVVRGTCDYCDKNKNDIWQGYAACVAAAYLAALLEEMFPD